MFTLHHTKAPSGKSASKTLLRVLTVAALLLASGWVVEPSDQVSASGASGAPAHAEHAAHMGNFNWMAALSAAHER